MTQSEPTHWPLFKGYEAICNADREEWPCAAIRDIAHSDPLREALREAIHAYFEKANDRPHPEYGLGCVHFEKGHGLYRLCDDPDTGVPIRALPDVLAALLTPPPSLRDALKSAGLMLAMGEVLAAHIYETDSGRYICRMCDADVTTSDSHADDCEIAALRAALEGEPHE